MSGTESCQFLKSEVEEEEELLPAVTALQHLVVRVGSLVLVHRTSHIPYSRLQVFFDSTSSSRPLRGQGRPTEEGKPLLFAPPHLLGFIAPTFFSYTSRISALPLFSTFTVSSQSYPFFFYSTNTPLTVILISFSALYTGSWLSSTSRKPAQIPFA